MVKEIPMDVSKFYTVGHEFLNLCYLKEVPSFCDNFFFRCH